MSNLPFDMDVNDIKNFLAKYSPVRQVYSIFDKKKRFIGCAFARVNNANRAIQDLDSVEFQGRVIRVNHASNKVYNKGFKKNNKSFKKKI